MDERLARRLVAEQFPRWAGLPVVPVSPGGWDNTIFRLGDDLVLRLPSADVYAAQVEKEQRWLPVLGPQLPLPVPVPVAMGRPSPQFPRPWSVYRWIEGDAATPDRITDLAAFASELAGFLRQLEALDARSGPPPGEHSFWRGAPLDVYDAQTRATMRLLGDEVDARALGDIWEAALASRWDGAPVWVHGDIAPSNLLVADGRLRAVIDFGCAAVGDPACDLVMAWTFFTGESRQVFRRRLDCDETTWARARGWALWKALVTLAEERHAGPAAAAARRSGWRVGAREVVDLVLHW